MDADAYPREVAADGRVLVRCAHVYDTGNPCRSPARPGQAMCATHADREVAAGEPEPFPVRT